MSYELMIAKMRAQKSLKAKMDSEPPVVRLDAGEYPGPVERRITLTEFPAQKETNRDRDRYYKIKVLPKQHHTEATVISFQVDGERWYLRKDSIAIVPGDVLRAICEKKIRIAYLGEASRHEYLADVNASTEGNDSNFEDNEKPQWKTLGTEYWYDGKYVTLEYLKENVFTDNLGFSNWQFIGWCQTTVRVKNMNGARQLIRHIKSLNLDEYYMFLKCIMPERHKYIDWEIWNPKMPTGDSIGERGIVRWICGPKTNGSIYIDGVDAISILLNQ